MIVVDSSVWFDFFNGVSTPEVERLDGLLDVTPIAIGDLILVEVVQGFRQEKDGATARQLFRSLAPLSMLGTRNAWKAAENYRELRRRGITVRKTIDWIIATACNCFAEARRLRGEPAAAIQQPGLSAVCGAPGAGGRLRLRPCATAITSHHDQPTTDEEPPGGHPQPARYGSTVAVGSARPGFGRSQRPGVGSDGPDGSGF